MNKSVVLIILLFIFSNTIYAEYTPEKKENTISVELIATITIKNKGDKILAPYNISLTYPSLNTSWQDLNDIEYPYFENYTRLFSTESG